MRPVSHIPTSDPMTLEYINHWNCWWVERDLVEPQHDCDIKNLFLCLLGQLCFCLSFLLVMPFQFQIKISYLNKPITKVDAISKAVCAGKVTIKRCWVELSENENFVDTTVDAVAHWHIYEPISSTNWHLKPHTQVMQANRASHNHFSLQSSSAFFTNCLYPSCKMGCINAMVHNHNIQFGKKLFVREILISEEGFTQNTRIGKEMGEA